MAPTKIQWEACATCAMAYFIIASLAGSAGRFISRKGYNEKEVEIQTEIFV